LRRKGDPAKLAIADWLRRETVPTMTAIAAKLHLGSPKGARARLREHKAKKSGQANRLNSNPLQTAA
jgi:hypothetical protein